MGFGKPVSKKKTPKRVKTKQDIEKDNIRDNVIINQIAIIIENTDAGCIDVQRIRNKLKGVENIDSYIDECIKKNKYIKHKGWVFGKLWSVNDVNSISNTIVAIDNYDVYNKNIDYNLMKHLRIINKGTGVNTKQLETLCQRGVLGMNRDIMKESLKRLISEGKIYEPTIGVFVPLSFRD